MTSPARRRVVFLAGSRFSTLGGAVARQLDAERFELHAMALPVTLGRVRRVTPGQALRKLREVAVARASRWLGGAPGEPALCDVPGVTVHEVERIGDAASTALVGALHPFACVNTGGCGILRAPFLAAAGPVLNVHCGLPWTRGFNAVEWTVWYGLQVRLSVHLIDEGVDTGPVICGRAFPLPAGRDTDGVRTAFEPHYAGLLLEAIERLDREGPSCLAPQDLSRGGPHFAMHTRLRRVLDGHLARGTSPGAWTDTLDDPGSAQLDAARMPDVL